MKSAVHTPNAPAAVGPYSQAVCAAPFVFTAGQLGLDPATGQLVGDTAPSQTAQALANIKAVLAAAGSSVAHIVKTTIFVADIGSFAEVNAEYAAFFEAEGVVDPPARSTVEVSGMPKDALVQIETVALLPT
jgi:2-iminobutanoate/2-iminopropanoate deaminase